MDCTDLKAFLSGIVDDELDPATRRDAERHLVECASCRGLVSRVESLDGELRAAAQTWGADRSLPRDLIDAVMVRVGADAAIGRRARRWAISGWIAAAAALGFAVSGWVGPLAAWSPAPSDGATRAERAALGAERALVQAPDPVRPAPAGGEACDSGAAALAATCDEASRTEGCERRCVDGPPGWLVAKRPPVSLVGDALVEPLEPIALERHADTIFAASLLIAQIAEGRAAAVPTVHRVVVYDGLDRRLREALVPLRAPWARESVQAAIAIVDLLLLATPDAAEPIDAAQLDELVDDIDTIGLPERLDLLSRELHLLVTA